MQIPLLVHGQVDTLGIILELVEVEVQIEIASGRVRAAHENGCEKQYGNNKTNLGFTTIVQWMPPFVF